MPEINLAPVPSKRLSLETSDVHRPSSETRLVTRTTHEPRLLEQKETAEQCPLLLLLQRHLLRSSAPRRPCRDVLSLPRLLQPRRCTKLDRSYPTPPRPPLQVDFSGPRCEQGEEIWLVRFEFQLATFVARRHASPDSEDFFDASNALDGVLRGRGHSLVNKFENSDCPECGVACSISSVFSFFSVCFFPILVRQLIRRIYDSTSASEEQA